MRKLSIITTTIIFLLTLSATNLKAQYRPGKTSSEKAAYGYPSETFSARKKQKKRHRHKSKKKSKKQQPANKNKKPLFRKKSPWVS